MSAISIQCPQTFSEVSVGLETDYLTFHTLPDVQSTMHCPACGAVHVWSKNSAMLSDDYPPHRFREMRAAKLCLIEDLSRGRPETRWAA